MTSENTLTGRNGNFSFAGQEIARVTQWAVNPTLATSNEWGDSDSGGYTNRSAGRRDATFTTEGKYDSSNTFWDIFQPEDLAAAVLYCNLALQPFWNFPRALCTDFNMSVNIDTEEVIGWTASHGADGTYSPPTA